MSNSLRAVEAKAPSKFHGPYHQQQRMQAKMRQAKAFGLFLEGKPLTEIADEVGCHYSTIWRYIRHENQACRVANIEKAEAIREQLLHVYNKIVKEALAGWERSCQTGSQLPNH
jgi:hypothetical protein